MNARPLDLSVVMPFGDDEDVIGRACHNLASYLRQLAFEFEIIAADDNSGDNCHAMLSLLRSELPEIRVVAVSARPVEAGVAVARGRVLWLIEPAAAIGPLGAAGHPLSRVMSGRSDMALLGNRFVICRRTPCYPAINHLRGRGHDAYQRLSRRAKSRGLRVDVFGTGGRPAKPTPAILRVLSALTAGRGQAA